MIQKNDREQHLGKAAIACRVTMAVYKDRRASIVFTSSYNAAFEHSLPLLPSNSAHPLSELLNIVPLANQVHCIVGLGKLIV